jgi:hypothetical protein
MTENQQSNTDSAHDAILSGMAINQSQVEDRDRVIPYRPQFNRITGKVTASLLLQQIRYWWYKVDRRPFYKFKQPCDHELYQEGDSWCEELDFSRSVFDTALKCVAKKITRGTSKAEALKHHAVIYWTDSNRLTWYQVNEKLLGAYVYLAYNEPELLDKVGKSLYLDDDDNLHYLDDDGKSLYLSSESTSETTSERKQSAKPDVSPDEPEPEPEPVETFEDLFPVIEKDPSTGQEQRDSILGIQDPLGMAAECAKRRNGDIPDWAMTGLGPDPWWDPLKAFCEITNRPVDKMRGKTGKSWLRQFSKIGEDKDINPILMAQATRALPDIQGVKWKIDNNIWTDPWSDSYIGILDYVAALICAGGQEEKERAPIIVSMDKTPEWLK